MKTTNFKICACLCDPSQMLQPWMMGVLVGFSGYRSSQIPCLLTGGVCDSVDHSPRQALSTHLGHPLSDVPWEAWSQSSLLETRKFQRCKTQHICVSSKVDYFNEVTDFTVCQAVYFLVADSLNEILHLLRHFSNWSPVVDTVWRSLGGVAMLYKMCHSGTIFEDPKPPITPSSPFLCLLLAVLNVSSQLFLQPPLVLLLPCFTMTQLVVNW